MAKEMQVNYEQDEDEALDEVSSDIELLDEEYVDDVDDSDDVSGMPTAEEAEQRQRVEALKSRLEGGETDTASAMKEVVEQLKELREKPKTAEVQQELEDWETVKKRVKDGFYDDPVEAVEKLMERRWQQYEREKLQPAFQQIAGVVRDTALDGSKRAARDTDTGKFVMDKYLGEVEQLVNTGQVQVGPGAYAKAVQQVAMNHMDEYVNWKVDQAVSARAEEEAAQPAKGANPASGGSAPRPNSKIQVSKAAQSAIYKMADMKGIDRDMFFESYVRRNPDKIRELNRRK